MPEKLPQDFTQILKAWSGGNREAFDELIPIVYETLREIAAQHLRRESGEHTLQPTALVHEVYLKLVDLKSVNWHDRTHFFAVAAKLMRQILIDHARHKKAQKRGGIQTRVALNEAVSFPAEQRDFDVLMLDEALSELASFDELQAKIVELRFFGGLTFDETAHALGLSPTSVKREWELAKAWLYKRMTE